MYIYIIELAEQFRQRGFYHMYIFRTSRIVEIESFLTYILQSSQNSLYREVLPYVYIIELAEQFRQRGFYHIYDRASKIVQIERFLPYIIQNQQNSYEREVSTIYIYYRASRIVQIERFLTYIYYRASRIVQKRGFYYIYYRASRKVQMERFLSNILQSQQNSLDREVSTIYIIELVE